MNNHLLRLEFIKIIDMLKAFALSDAAKHFYDGLEPYTNEDVCRKKINETTAARAIFDACGSPPLSSMGGLEEILTLAEASVMLVPEQLMSVARFAISCRQLTSYLRRGEAVDYTVASYGAGLVDLGELRGQIESAVREDTVLDEASPTLRDIRRHIEHTEGQIKEKLNHALKSRKQYLADSYIAYRNNRYVLPVQRKYQGQFGGSVVEVSGKGAVVFMEPSSVTRLQDELSGLRIEEDGEVRRVLYALTAQVAEAITSIRRNIEAMVVLDTLFAKAKLSAAMDAHPPEITGRRCIDIRQGRHPLLPKEGCVPLDFKMDEHVQGVVITGPNTGGKTVAVKTVGLLSTMAQCGLHVPCGPASLFAMHDNYWCDIGDSQDISQNLSTFSGHMVNVIDILSHVNKDSLVLLDELGSGTDPAEGMGIAIAVLDELRARGCMFLVTTHYPEVKSYATEAGNIQAARMAFDRESLRPLYRLEMGKTGDSCALHIARQLGMPQHILARAHHTVYGGEIPPSSQATVAQAQKSRLVRTEAKRSASDPSTKFSMGDSVVVLPQKDIGIVYRPADEMGNVIVQIKGIKQEIRHNRLQLKVLASELYPPDYDFSIILILQIIARPESKWAKDMTPL